MPFELCNASGSFRAESYGFCVLPCIVRLPSSDDILVFSNATAIFQDIEVVYSSAFDNTQMHVASANTSFVTLGMIFTLQMQDQDIYIWIAVRVLDVPVLPSLA